MPNPTFEQMRELTRYKRNSFASDIKSEVTGNDDGKMLILTRRLDDHHDLSVIMLFNKDLTVENIACQMERMTLSDVFGYGNCVSGPNRAKCVTAPRVERNSQSGGAERTACCTHFAELIEASLMASVCRFEYGPW